MQQQQQRVVLPLQAMVVQQQQRQQQELLVLLNPALPAAVRVALLGSFLTSKHKRWQQRRQQRLGQLHRQQQGTPIVHSTPRGAGGDLGTTRVGVCMTLPPMNLVLS
jgi:hypothetical protein